MSVIIENKQGLRIFVKGASETVLSGCTKVIGPNGVEHILDSSVKK